MTTRVVITGMGMVTPLGPSVDATWRRLMAAETAVAPVNEFSTEGFPTRIAAQAKEFDPTQYLDVREVRRTARFTQLAVAATEQALQESSLNLETLDRRRVGLQIGSAIGGISIIEEQTVVLRQEGARRINPTFVPTVIVSAAPCHLAVRYGIHGPTGAPAAACATGIVALGDALHWLQGGEVDVVLAGGTESTVSPLALASFSRLGALSTRNDDPAHACRPFDVSRDGTVLGEGAAVLVLETLEHAQSRGARILGELLGYGLMEDGFHMTAPEPNGAGAAMAMDMALRTARLAPEAIGLVVAHGTGTPLNDVAETKAIHQVFGGHARRLVVISNKGSIGHTLGAAGAVSTVVALKAMQEGWVPPTANLQTPDPECDLDYVPGRPRQVSIGAALVNAIGFGGQNASLIVRGWHDK
ncbi:MAG: beta-ketoacyl-ACP synthase II [Anaerolineae bacterium]